MTSSLKKHWPDPIRALPPSSERDWENKLKGKEEEDGLEDGDKRRMVG